jgi:hypothetical protein
MLGGLHTQVIMQVFTKISHCGLYAVLPASEILSDPLTLRRPGLVLLLICGLQRSVRRSWFLLYYYSTTNAHRRREPKRWCRMLYWWCSENFMAMHAWFETKRLSAPRTDDYNIHFRLPVKKKEIADGPAKAKLHSSDTVQLACTKIRSAQWATGQERGHKTGQFQSTLHAVTELWTSLGKTFLRPTGRARVSGNVGHGVDAPPLAATDGH